MGIDYQEALVDESKANVKRWKGPKGYSVHHNIHFEEATIYDFKMNDYSYLHPNCDGGFDTIHVGATADENVLKNLETFNMKSPSRMVIPIKHDDHEVFYKIDKDKDGHYDKEQLLNVQYVPLVKSQRPLGDDFRNESGRGEPILEFYSAFSTVCIGLVVCSTYFLFWTDNDKDF